MIDNIGSTCDDDIVCSICIDGSVYENNEIILCDRCDVAVHQACYGVQSIPEGEWLCDICADSRSKQESTQISNNHSAAGIDCIPDKTICELCSNMGGAYVRTDDAVSTNSLFSHYNTSDNSV